jgi:hypothetical protein
MKDNNVENVPTNSRSADARARTLPISLLLNGPYRRFLEIFSHLSAIVAPKCALAVVSFPTPRAN